MASQLPVPLRIAQVVGITSSAFLTGYISAYSIGVVPTISTSAPKLRAKQWNEAYSIGASTAPFIAIGSTVAWVLLARDATNHPFRHNPDAKLYYSLAAAFIPAIIPWTLLGMRGVNNELKAKAKAADSAMEGEKASDGLNQLLGTWYWWNVGRALLPATGAIIGTAAVSGLVLF